MSLTLHRHQIQTLTLPDGWSRCRPAEEIALASQLQRELRPGHALHGRDCVALARRGACDDVLFFAAGPSPNLAVVHLTWQVPRDPRVFPWTAQFSSAAEWARSVPLLGRSTEGEFDQGRD